jgi:ribose transport system substrate-binding protein
MKNRFFTIMTVLILTATFGAFAGGEGESDADETPTIGYSVWTMEFTFFQNLEKGVRDAAEELGYDYIMIDQNADPTKMVQDLSSLVGQGVDGIVVTPVDPGSIAPAVRNARQAGIPVVVADIGYSGPINALLVSNNYEGGRKAMDLLHELIDDPSQSVAVGKQKPQFTYSTQRDQGFLDRARELGYNIAAEIVVENQSAEGGYDTMQQMLSADPDLAGAFFSSGREAVGAANAVQAAGADTHVVGFNGDPEELQAIRDGILAGTIAQQPWLIGYESVMLLQDIFNGEELDEEIVPVEVMLVTPDNIDEVEATFRERRGQ